MIKITRGKFPFYQFTNLSACPGVVHFISSRAGDIGYAEEKDAEVITENRRLLAEAVGFDGNKWVTAHQIHGTHVTVITSDEAGQGAWDKETRIPDTDALVTQVEGICLMVLSADCVPILLYDPVKRVIGAIHAGWRGTAAQIVKKTIRIMEKEFECLPAHIMAAIGPSIGKCCFEVGEEVAEVFREVFVKNEKIVYSGLQEGKYQVDLWEANRQELLEAGLVSEHVEVAGMCSVCHPDRFFSYRREGQQAGRFGAGIILSSEKKGLSDEPFNDRH